MENPNVLKEWFHHVDSNNAGSINASQLKNALAVGNLNFPLTVVQQMIRMYDFDKNGTMDFEEFVALNKFLLKVQNAFSQLDRGNGFLTPEDVHQSFDQNKMGMVRLDAFISLCIFVQSARNLFNSFDATKQGRVTLDFNQFVYCTANCRI
ncbi:peflin-like isoform X3 [Phalaenopsis equestris]|uniref:peflin-like isoform X3 n=1 Tax=Phalaenopsis equestris TaxID=78828 RepID=UPI0009E1D8DA|nr:peflin-like isoform X3 [Phalaenopsis equestris]